VVMGFKRYPSFATLTMTTDGTKDVNGIFGNGTVSTISFYCRVKDAKSVRYFANVKGEQVEHKHSVFTKLLSSSITVPIGSVLSVNDTELIVYDVPNRQTNTEMRCD